MASQAKASEAEKRPISRQEALETYLALGPGRSFTRLLNAYRADTSVRVPALATVKKWSQKEGWAERAAEFDAMVAARTSEKSIENAAEHRALTSDALSDAASKMLDKALLLVGKLDGEGGEDSVKAIEVLTDQLVALSQHATVLSGGVSDRREEVSSGTFSEERAAALARIQEITAAQKQHAH